LIGRGIGPRGGIPYLPLLGLTPPEAPPGPLGRAFVDALFFPLGRAMNTGIVTTGLIPVRVGSTEAYQTRARLNGLFWDLAGGSATLTITGPGGITYSLPATIVGGQALASWTVSDPPGAWRRFWSLTDSRGVVQVSNDIDFSVVSNP
jgi:hypothetical protein